MGLFTVPSARDPWQARVPPRSSGVAFRHHRSSRHDVLRGSGARRAVLHDDRSRSFFGERSDRSTASSAASAAGAGRRRRASIFQRLHDLSLEGMNDRACSPDDQLRPSSYGSRIRFARPNVLAETGARAVTSSRQGRCSGFTMSPACGRRRTSEMPARRHPRCPPD